MATETPTKIPTLVLLLFLLISTGWVGLARADGMAIVQAVDGDTLDVGGVHHRIWGIEAPELDIATGRAARIALANFIRGKTVRCEQVGKGPPNNGASPRTSHGRPVSRCFVDVIDVAGEMVRQGHAIDWPKYSGGYYGAIMTDAELPGEIAALILAMDADNAAETVTSLRRRGIRLLKPVTDIDAKTALDADFTAAISTLSIAIVGRIDPQDIERHRNDALAMASRMAAKARRALN